MDSDVIFEENQGVRKVILNRQKKLNILSYEMICRMLHKLELYETDPTVKLVILKGEGKAFCAGGDVTSVITIVTAGNRSFGSAFYRKLLTLNYLLGTYKKPVVALINGIVMGAGAGLSMHAKFRIVTERTEFAMPEVTIGHFADVGASHFLSRLSGSFGEYLGLTGARLNGIDMLACGLATHFVCSKDISTLENELVSSMEHSMDAFDTRTIADIINKFSQPVKLVGDSPYLRLDSINKCFSKDKVEDIKLALENLPVSKKEKWMTQAISSVKSYSPIGLKLSLRSIRVGRYQTFEQCLVREFNMFCHAIWKTATSDLFEGTRAMLMEKDMKPQWNPSELELVSDEMVNKCFENVDDRDWEPLQLPARSTSANYSNNVQSKL